MGEEMSANFRLALREELGPVFDRLTAIEVRMTEQKEAARESSIGPRLSDLEKKFERLNGRIIGLGSAAGLIVSLVFKLIGA